MRSCSSSNLVLLLVVALSPASSADYIFSAVNWSLASANDIANVTASLLAPIGCSCLQHRGGVCVYFQCDCTCDLTAGACDPDCCCDQECTDQQHASMVAKGLCETQSASQTTSDIQYCSTDLLTLAKGFDPTKNNPLVADSVLCVAVDNNEVAGRFLHVPAEESVSVTRAFLNNPKTSSFVQLEPRDVADVAASYTTTGEGYELDDPLRILPSNIAGAQMRLPILTLSLPAPSSDECVAQSPVLFDRNSPAIDCVVHVANLSALCEDRWGSLSAAAVVQDFVVARWPNASGADSLDSLLSVEVVVDELGNGTNVTSATPLSAPYPPYFPRSQWLNGTCKGALLRLHYDVSHDGLGHIERIVARVTIGDVSLPSEVPSASVQVRQVYSATFSSTATLAANVRSLANGNLATYSRSGNPGYLKHWPLRVGTLQTKDGDTQQAVSEMAGGLRFPGAGDCLNLARPLTTVRFGEDMRVACSMTVTRSDLEALCSQPGALIDTLRVNFSHVAAFGNSDPFLVSEWLAIEYDAPTRNSATFTSVGERMEATCKDLVTAVNVELLVAAVGPVDAPQNKIVAARAYHSKSTWSVYGTDTLAPTTMFMHINVNYVWVKQTQIEDWIPPAPSIWFTIPSDVFYPFMLNSATGPPNASPSVVLLVVLSCWILQ